ncbi:MAG: hypothetical protein KatS3mg110_2436 [Pirellulaceae bacterium]|nr:MAG: hypothetical protein KatS3mg110_2436 [Pirellulaceae bacterium]
MKVTCPVCGTVNDLDVLEDDLTTCRQCGFEMSTLLESLRAGLPTGSWSAELSLFDPTAAEETRAAIAPAQQYVGHFRLERLLGEGSSAEVYQAWDEQLQRPVAVKLPRQKWSSGDALGAHFCQEARAAARLRHPGIVQVYEVVELDDGGLAVVMEYVGGQTLRDKLHEGKVDPQQAARWMLQVCRALHYAHKRGFVHRDLKPANIAIDSDGEARILDFGLAMHESQAQSHSGEVAGTWPYMAPEQVRGETEKLDGRCDIWAVGVILYELLTGRRPFLEQGAKLREAILERPPRPLRQLDESIPRPLEAICLRCLEKDVTKRYSSAYDVAEDLKAFLRRGKLASRRGRSGWLIGLAVVILLAGGAWSLGLALPGRQRELDNIPPWQKVWTPASPIRDFSSSIRGKWYSVLDRPPIRLFGSDVPFQSWDYHQPTETVTLSGDGGLDLVAGVVNQPNFSVSVRTVIGSPQTTAGILFGFQPADDPRHWICQELQVARVEDRFILMRTFNWGEVVSWPNSNITDYIRKITRHSRYVPIPDPHKDEHLLEIKVESNHLVGVWWDRQKIERLSDEYEAADAEQWKHYSTNCQGLFGFHLDTGLARFTDLRIRVD